VVGNVYTPASNFNGNAVLQVTVSDGTTTTTQNVQVYVSPVNDAPTVASPPALSMQEDGNLIIKASDLLINASDVDANSLSITSISSNAGTLTDNGNGTWTLTPASNFNGAITLTYSVSDGSATVNNVTATVNVAAVNDAPVVNSPAAFNGTEDGGPIAISSAALLANTNDVEGDILSVTSLTVPANQGTISGGPTNWVFTPAANFNGTATLSFTVSDGTNLVTKNANVNVTAVNDAPSSSSYSLNMLANNALIISAIDILSHVTDVDNDALSITNLTTNTGTLTDNGNGTWTFVPNENYVGSVNLQYTVSDGNLNSSNQITVNVADNPDLQFNFNNQASANPNYTTSDNVNIDQPPQFNQAYNYTDNDGTQVTATYADANTANVSVTQESITGKSNIEASSNEAGSITTNDFDRVDISLGDNGNSTVNVYDSEQGNIYTGSGNDSINVTTGNTADSLNNNFRIDSGDGDDSISVIGDNDSTIFHIDSGIGTNSVQLQGKYASADIFGGSGNDTIIGSNEGNDIYHFGENSGQDTFNGGGGIGWADSIMLESSTPVSVTQTSSTSWTLIVDGQEATLTTDTNGTVNPSNNHIDFDGTANGTLIMQDGSTLNFQNIDHVEW
jgi:hypothetical protein